MNQTQGVLAGMKDHSEKIKEVAPITVEIASSVLQQLELYICKCPIEISGLGQVGSSPDTLLRVESIYLLDQEASSADTALDPKSIVAFMAHRIEQGEKVVNLKLWWHSHHNMEVFWSGTDEEAIESFKDAGWLLSIVGNHRKEYLARVDYFPSKDQPFRLTLPAEIAEIKEYDPKEVELIEAEIRDKVKRRGMFSHEQRSGRFGR